MKKFLAIAASTLVTSAALVAAPGTAAPAQASCGYSTGSYTWTVEQSSRSSRPTNATSDWVEARYRDAGVSFVHTTTGTASMTVSASMGAEAGVVLAKYKTEFGVSVTGSISGTKGYTYSLTVPKGYQGRAHLYQESRRFVAKKWYHPYPCGSALVKTVAVNAPLANRTSFVWKLDLRRI